MGIKVGGAHYIMCAALVVHNITTGCETDVQVSSQAPYTLFQTRSLIAKPGVGSMETMGAECLLMADRSTIGRPIKISSDLIVLARASIDDGSVERS
jgi:hypothetical protein